jgi:hypothetical protein
MLKLSNGWAGSHSNLDNDAAGNCGFQPYHRNSMEKSLKGKRLSVNRTLTLPKK